MKHDPNRTIAEMLADHGIFYTVENHPRFGKCCHLHGPKGYLGHFGPFNAIKLVEELEDGES